MRMRSTALALDVWAAELAALFAQECGMPVGNYWVAPLARHLMREVESGKSRDEVRGLFAFQLGIAILRRDEARQAAAAVDPHADSTGTPTPREKV